MTQDRAQLLARLAQAMAATGDSVPGPWDGYSIVAEVTALGVRATGFRYSGDAPGQPMLMGSDAVQTISDLRLASPGPNGEMFDVYLARLNRATGEILDQAFSSDTGAGYRVTAANVGRIAALARPGLPFLPPSPAAPPPQQQVEAEVLAAVRPQPEVESAVDAGLDEPILPTPAIDEISAEAAEIAAASQPQPEVEASETENETPAVTSPSPPAFAVPLAHTPPAVTPPPPPAPPQPAPEQVAALTTTITNSPELADSQWLGYGAAVSFSDHAIAAVGFRYTDQGAIPTFVGGSFLPLLRTLQQANRAPHGELPGAALIRLSNTPGSAVQLRFVFGAAAAQITWSAADEVMAGRLRPESVTAATTLAPRPAPDLLDANALLSRLKADVAASLRGRDGWRSFSLGVDLPLGRVASFVYTDDGTPIPFQPALSPLADLAELRIQTARPDGSQWAGAVLHSWRAGGDRVDVNFYGEAGINDYLAQGPDAAGMTLRPMADPPEAQPRPPWPPTGGHLDTQALTASVSAAVLSSPELTAGDWDRLAVVIKFDDMTPSVSALRFRDGAPGTVTAIPNPGPIGKLRRSNPNELGWQWDVCVLRGSRGASWLEPEFRFGHDADDYRVDSGSIERIGERLRPV